MRSRGYPIIGAVTTLVVGMAFLLLGCYPRPPVELTAKEKVAGNLFDLAERDFRAGNYDRALEEYESYLTQAQRGEKPRIALYRMAKINEEKNLYNRELDLLRKISLDYPYHPETPTVQLDIAKTYYRLGEYQMSSNEISAWLARYPTHPLRGEALFSMGQDCKALGDNRKAFYWWLRANREFPESSERRGELNDRILGLIGFGTEEDLKEMAKYATGDDYAPQIYHQLASIYLEKNRLDEAKEAAMALVRSTPEQRWVTAGREILERIEEELSVRKGVIGCLLPLSGPYAIYGQEALNGIQLGMGMLDVPKDAQNLELVIRDTRGEEEAAVQGVEDLAKTEKVIAIIGPLASKPSLAAAKKAQELGVPIITLSQKEGITDEGDMIFRNFLTPSKEVKSLLDRAMGEMGLRSFGILYPDNPYGRVFMNLFWDQVEERGGAIRAVESYSSNETDFAVQIKKMVGLYYPRPESVIQQLKAMKATEGGVGSETNPDSKEKEPDPIVDFDAVFIPDNAQQVALLAPQFPFQNVFGIRLLGTSLWQSSELVEAARDYVQGAIFPSGFFSKSDSPIVQEFVEHYRQSFDSEPGVLAANGYDTIIFLKNILNDEGIKTKKDFQERLLSYNGYQGVTGKISFNQEGEVQKDPLLLTISGKHFYLLP